jgi:ABC-type antimicrobial peptide transport system permease subunit
MSHSVVQRRRELGIRMALGAQPIGVLRMVVREAFVLALGGTVAGVAIALTVGRIIRGLLHGVPPYDARIYLAVTGVLAGTALAAAWLPARRAARVDPIGALRAD